MAGGIAKVISIIRSQEWWEYKLPPLLAIGYATALSSSMPLYKVAPWLLFLLVAVMVGAVYVSVTNDITDLEEDLASGKSNRIAAVKPQLRWLIPTGCILIGLIFIYFLYPDYISILLYIMPWIAFSLYSYEPIRLKRRGILGVFADASGSHLFISLLFVASTSYFTGIAIDWVWFIAVGVWAFSYGLRGILWHQFFDRDNDLKVNLNTYASKIDPSTFRNKTILLMVIELSSVAVMLIKINEPLLWIFLGFYLLLVWIRSRKFGYKVIAIMTPPDEYIEIIMLDYYQVFLPIALLITASIYNPLSLIVLGFHLLLFHQKAYTACKDFGKTLISYKL